MDPASTSFILGYHGCDRRLAERVFVGKATLKPSHNDYDWLGDGIYFWEHNARRAFDFAAGVAERAPPVRTEDQEPGRRRRGDRPRPVPEPAGQPLH